MKISRATGSLAVPCFQVVSFSSWACYLSREEIPWRLVFSCDLFQYFPEDWLVGCCVAPQRCITPPMPVTHTHTGPQLFVSNMVQWLWRGGREGGSEEDEKRWGGCKGKWGGSAKHRAAEACHRHATKHRLLSHKYGFLRTPTETALM